MGIRQALVPLGLAFVCAGCGSTTDTTPSDTTSASATPAPPVAPHAARAHPAHRSAVSSGSVRFGQQTKTSGCQPRRTLPDPGCTPGSIITQATTTRICVAGYSRGVRNVPESLKLAVYAEYGIASHVAGQYEVDHLVPLELGGSNSIANLWPEVAPGFHQKDVVENELHDAVCSGGMALRVAQTRIAQNWRTAGVSVPAPSSGSSFPGPARRSYAPPSSTPSDASFCNTHPCIASFATGRGTIVQCADGEWSHSGGLSGVCSRHGGPKG